MSALYDTVARLCAERRITVSAACRMAGVSPGILCDLKNGRKQTVSIETAARLARALHVSSDVFSGTAQQTEDAFLAFYGEVKDYLDDKDKDDLITFMRTKAEQNRGTGKPPHR